MNSAPHIRVPDSDDPSSVALQELPVLVPLSAGTSKFGPSRTTFYRLHAQGLIELVNIGRGRFIVTKSFLDYCANARKTSNKAVA